MPFSTLALIAVTVLVSSFLSGVFGMAGGMILLGVLLVYYDVTTAMVLFSIIQFAANGSASTHPLAGDELRALRQLRRGTKGAFVFASERGAPFGASGFARL